MAAMVTLLPVNPDLVNLEGYFQTLCDWLTLLSFLCCCCCFRMTGNLEVPNDCFIDSPSQYLCSYYSIKTSTSSLGAENYLSYTPFIIF